MNDPLADFMKKFNPETVSNRDAKRIADECAYIITTFCKGKNLLIDENETISFTPLIAGSPKQILLQPDNVSSGKMLSYYAELMKAQHLPKIEI